MPYKVKSRTIGEKNMPWSAIVYPVIASIKYDGRNTIVHKQGNKIIYETSGGKFFALVDNYPFDQLPDGHFFTEMMGANVAGMLGDRVYSGIQTSCVSNTSKGLPNTHKPSWKIFSFVNNEDYMRGKSSDKYWATLTRIKNWENELLGTFCPKFKKIYNEEELKAFYSSVLSAGWEGLMVSQASQTWDNSTSRLKTLCKLKGRYSVKGLCIDTVEGTGKYLNMIGSLALRLDSGAVVYVGSGLSDQERQTSSFIGQVVEIQYEQLSKDGIPIQPTYVCVREAM